MEIVWTWWMGCVSCWKNTRSGRQMVQEPGDVGEGSQGGWAAAISLHLVTQHRSHREGTRGVFLENIPSLLDE
jgi:hypothetical protein